MPKSRLGQLTHPTNTYSVPQGVTGKKWKPPFAGWSRKARAVVRDPESTFSPERQVSCQVRPLAAANWTAAPGQEQPVSLAQPWSFERQLHSGSCQVSYFRKSAIAAVGAPPELRQQCSRLLTVAVPAGGTSASSTDELTHCAQCCAWSSCPDARFPRAAAWASDRCCTFLSHQSEFQKSLRET